MNMKRFLNKLWLCATLLCAMTNTAYAQYYELAQQLPNLLSPALSGSMNYKGYVDLTATFGVGNERANFVGISTTQGFRYSSWFFMGVGLGVDLATSSLSNRNSDIDNSGNVIYNNAPVMSKTKAMIPVFSDFRFNFGNPSNTNFYIDIKAGATWLIGSSYLQLNNGALSNRAHFLLRPSIGIRIPTNKNNSRQAFNIGLTYQLITADNSWSYWGNNYGPTLNSIGASASYEW